jgi:integrase
MARKAASGTGTIRKKTVIRNGKEYTYWEARYTEGVDPGTGKQVQRSISGKTQKEVTQKLKAATTALDTGTYTAPSKVTVGQWLDTWTAEYLGGVKPSTGFLYSEQVRLYIKPALGAVKLEALTAPTIQTFYNALGKPRGEKPALSAKSIKNIHGILHKALQQAVAVEYLRFNPAGACTLPRIERKEISPLDDNQIASFMTAIKGHRFETLFTVDLFTGLREGEILGLMWDCIDFKNGTLRVDKQLKREQKKGGKFYFAPPKNDKPRTITPAPWVMELLKTHRAHQLEMRLRAGEVWNDTGLVFTDELGNHLSYRTIYDSYKRVVAGIGAPAARFHDLRHTYAVSSIRAGDDIKTVQSNLGHATAAFTLDIYGHVTEQMRKDSAARMEGFIKSVLNL